MTKQVQQSITPTHVIGSTGTADTSDLGYRALDDFKGDLGLGTSLTQTANNGNGTATNPAFTFTGDDNTGIFRPAADALGLVTNGSEKVRITSGGNVGIGVSSPSARLEVNGGAIFGSINGVRLFSFSRDDPATDTGIFKISSLALLAGTAYRGSFAKVSLFAGRRGFPGSDRQFAEFFVRIFGLSTYTADITRTAGDASVDCAVSSGANNAIELEISFDRPATMYVHLTIESQSGDISFVSGF
jgi:hypothetical protein